MKAIDICYTPLDTPEAPEYSVEKVKQWITENTETLQPCVEELCRRGLAGQNDVEKYPWKLVFAFWNEYGGWLNEFDKKFPELSKYLHEAFNLSEDELESILLLPMNNNIQGRGFWHNDGDRAGYRMYLHYENMNEDMLFLRKTVVPYDQSTWVKIKEENSDTWNDNILQSPALQCVITKPNQCFYLNNYRSAHATYVKDKPKNIPRIAVIINPKNVPEDDSLVVKSAKKFKEQAILWSNNVSETI